MSLLNQFLTIFWALWHHLLTVIIFWIFLFLVWIFFFWFLEEKKWIWEITQKWVMTQTIHVFQFHPLCFFYLTNLFSILLITIYFIWNIYFFKSHHPCAFFSYEVLSLFFLLLFFFFASLFINIFFRILSYKIQY